MQYRNVQYSKAAIIAICSSFNKLSIFLLEWVKQFVANKILKMELFSRICFMFRDKKIVYTFAKPPVKYLGKNHKYNFKKYFINIFVKVVCTSVLSRMKHNKPNILG